MTRGSLDRTEDNQLTPDPCESLFHITECCGERGSVLELLIVVKHNLYDGLVSILQNTNLGLL